VFSYEFYEKPSGLAISALRRAMLSWAVIDRKFRAPPYFRRHVKPLAPAVFAIVSTPKPNWARVVGYGPCFLCVIHKEGMCPSSRDINRLMMMTSFIEMRYKILLCKCRYENPRLKHSSNRLITYKSVLFLVVSMVIPIIRDIGLRR
jgi:hypothetical protein